MLVTAWPVPAPNTTVGVSPWLVTVTVAHMWPGGGEEVN